MDRFAYRRRDTSSSWRREGAAARLATSTGLVALGLGVLAMVGCTAGVRPTGTGAAGTGSPTGAGGVSGTTGVGNNGGTGPGQGGRAGTLGGLTGFAGIGGPDPDAAACQQSQVKFEPKIPTVYLLVDRSGSMFHCVSGPNTGNVICPQPANTAWANLKTAVRSVVTTLENDVRFGFATIWGTDPAGRGMCPALQGMTTDNVNPALGNATAIMTKYDSLQFPPETNQQGMKFESPASESITVVSKALQADATPGDKYILFITDGQPDYCDDSNSLCAPDSVIGQIQAAKAAGVTTVVLGLQTSLFDLGMGILKAYATAGAGEDTVAPLRNANDTITAFYDQCHNIAGWEADRVALGKPDERGATVGTYAAVAGPTNPYTPNAGDQAMLAAQLSSALAGVKSCVFDLSQFKINRTRLAEATVKIEGTVVPLDPGAANGWFMNTDTQLELFGTACTSWRNPNAKLIDFGFPCDIIVE